MKVAFIVVFGVIVLVVGYAFWANSKADQLIRQFELVKTGLTEKEVVSLLGEPSEIRDGCRDQPLDSNNQPMTTICAKQYQYDLALQPAFLTVAFDENGRAFSKYHYVSP